LQRLVAAAHKLAPGKDVADDVGRARNDPAYRIGRIEHRQLVVRGKDGDDPDNAQPTGPDGRYKHRQPRFAETADHAAADVHHAAGEVNRADPADAHHAEGDHVPVGGVGARNVDAQKLRAEEQADRAHRQADGERGHDAAPVDLPDALVFAGAEILARKGDGGLGDGVHAVVNEGIKARGRGVARDGARAEGVDRALDDDVRDVEDNARKSGGKADRNDLPGLIFIEAQLAQTQTAEPLSPEQEQQYKREGNVLRDDGRNGNNRHVEPEDNHEQQCQKHVHNAGDREIEEGPFGVAEGAQHGRAEIVDEGGGHTEKIDAQVLRRQRQHVARRLHEPEQRRGEPQPQHQHHDAEDRTERDGAVDGAADVLVLAAAEVARDQDVRADGQADEGSDQQVDECGGGTHRRERAAARELADDDDIGGVEQQLQDAGQHDGQAELQQRPQNGALGHVKHVGLG